MAEPPEPADADDEDARRGDRDYHLARIRAGFVTTVSNRERARELARLFRKATAHKEA